MRLPCANILILCVLISIGSASGQDVLNDRDAFVRVSPRDARYFELSDGRPYIPIGFNLVGGPKPEEFEQVVATLRKIKSITSASGPTSRHGVSRQPRADSTVRRAWGFCSGF